MFLPTTLEEIEQLGWKSLDIILITGDANIDSPHIGVSVIGNLLYQHGYRVGIISQPDIISNGDITRLGEPALFWGVTGGCIDSMVANYTSILKKRKSDDLTPGGLNNRRPDRAVIVYVNLIRKYFKKTKPIVIGGIEASLRRISHYDYWSDRIRRSILFDSKADILVYGMAEKTILLLAESIKRGLDIRDIPGICYPSNHKPDTYIELPSHSAVCQSKKAFIDSFHAFYQNNDPINATGLCQKQDNRYVIQNPPSPYITQSELDSIYEMDFKRDVHPYDKQYGSVKAVDTIQFSIISHLGCFGECNFCAINVHQGRTIRSRSIQSIIREAKRLVDHPNFKGIIQDVGGPTANMYGFECKKQQTHGSCKDKRCIFPEICRNMSIDHRKQISLLEKLRHVPGIRKVFVSSGIRYDLVLHDTAHGTPYLDQLICHHISGQMKVAPEHCCSHVLSKMGKPDIQTLTSFKQLFDSHTHDFGKKLFLTYYFIAAHPGCRETDMKALKHFTKTTLKITPEQIQIFTPTPSTWSSVMYHTEIDPFTGESIFVEKNLKKKNQQKKMVLQPFL